MYGLEAVAWIILGSIGIMQIGMIVYIILLNKYGDIT